jgi:hypothetical protein
VKFIEYVDDENFCGNETQKGASGVKKGLVSQNCNFSPYAAVATPDMSKVYFDYFSALGFFYLVFVFRC